MRGKGHGVDGAFVRQDGILLNAPNVFPVRLFQNDWYRIATVISGAGMEHLFVWTASALLTEKCPVSSSNGPREIMRRASAVGLSIPRDLAERLEVYLSLLSRWNRRINLTGLEVD